MTTPESGAPSRETRYYQTPEMAFTAWFDGRPIEPANEPRRSRRAEARDAWLEADRRQREDSAERESSAYARGREEERERCATEIAKLGDASGGGPCGHYVRNALWQAAGSLRAAPAPEPARETEAEPDCPGSNTGRHFMGSDGRCVFCPPSPVPPLGSGAPVVIDFPKPGNPCRHEAIPLDAFVQVERCATCGKMARVAETTVPLNPCPHGSTFGWCEVCAAQRRSVQAVPAPAGSGAPLTEERVRDIVRTLLLGNPITHALAEDAVKLRKRVEKAEAADSELDARVAAMQERNDGVAKCLIRVAELERRLPGDIGITVATLERRVENHWKDHEELIQQIRARLSALESRPAHPATTEERARQLAREEIGRWTADGAPMPPGWDDHEKRLAELREHVENLEARASDAAGMDGRMLSMIDQDRDRLDRLESRPAPPAQDTVAVPREVAMGLIATVNIARVYSRQRGRTTNLATYDAEEAALRRALEQK